MNKVLKANENNQLQAAKDEWQQSLNDKRKSKAMRQKRKNGRGKAWQLAV